MAMEGGESRANDHPAFWRSRIGRRLLFTILAFSSLITLAIAAFDLYLDYRLGIAAISDRLKQVELSYAAPLGESLWNLDKRLIALQLEGIADLPDISFVEIREIGSADPTPISVAVGQPVAGPSTRLDIPISCNCAGSVQTIGVLHVEATLANLYGDLFRRAQVLLAGQAVKTFLVATFILFVIHRYVTRHLLAVAGAMAGFAPGSTPSFRLRRGRQTPDEIDEVAEAFNTLRERMERHGAAMSTANARMAAILDNIPDLAWVKDLEGRFIAANRPLAATFGLADPAELIGKTDFDFSPYDIAEGYWNDDLEVMRSGARRRTDEAHVRADGTTFQVETIKGPLRAVDGGIVGTVGIARDVTERRAMEEALRETATRLEALIANVQATVYRSTYSIHGPRLSMQVYGAGTASGHATADINAGPLEDCKLKVHPDDRQREFDDIGREFDRCGYVERTCRILSPDGDVRTLLVRERVVARDGDTVVTEGLSIDISGEVKTRLALEESEAKLRENSAFFETLLRTTAEGVVVEDMDGRIVFCNPAAESILGRGCRDLDGHAREGWNGEYVREDGSLFLHEDCPLVSTMRTGEARRGVVLGVPHPERGRVWIRINSDSIKSQDGRPAMVMATFSDITDRAEVETALRARELEFRTLAENSPDLIMRYDRECRRVYVNPAYERATGIPNDQAVNVTPDVQWTIRNVTPPIEEYRAALQGVMDTGEPTQVLVGWTRSFDGARVAHAVHLVPDRDPEGAIKGVLAIGHDVTVLKRTERRLQALIDNLPGRTYRVRVRRDGMRQMTYTGGKGPDLLGLSADPGRWMEPGEAVPYAVTDDAGRLGMDLSRQIADRDSFELKYRVIPPGGTLHWIMSRGKVVKRGSDEIIIEGIVLDITEEMVAKQALETSERRYRELVDAMPVGIMTISAAGRIVLVNDALSVILGRPQVPGEVPWWPEEWMVHPDGRPIPAHERPAARVLRGNRSVRDSEVIVRRPDGACRHLLVSLTPSRDTEGAAAGVTMTAVDITERKHTELMLERLNRTLRTLGAANQALVHSRDEAELLRQTCEAVVTTGGYRMAWVGLAENDDARTIRPVAHAGLEDGYLSLARISWGDTPEGRGPTGLAIRTGKPQINCNTASNVAMSPWQGAALERGYRSTMSLPLVGPSGPFGCLNIYASDPDAFSVDEIGLFSDLANNLAYGFLAMRERQLRQEVERHLHQAQKMEALGQLAGSVAHDFNNLLGAILGFARFIIEDAAPDDPSRNHAAHILSAGRRGKALIGQILSFARRGDLKRERFAVADLLAEAQALLKATIPATTQVVVVACAPGDAVEGDRDQLTQVLLNLAINAHDALAGGIGTVTVQVRPTRADDPVLLRLPHRRGETGGSPPFHVWADENGISHAVQGVFDPAQPHVSLVVSDNGCGMDAKLLEMVFAPFFTTKGKGHGTGLGLALVHSIVLAHGGALAVESCPDCGSTFEVVLPCVDEASPVQHQAEPVLSVPQLAPGRVLLVDDDPDFGGMMLSALERKGFEVSPCSDPLEALAGVREHMEFWDAVVTDQTMPGMTGLDLIREIKILRPDLPCILCTGYAQDNLDEAKLREAGVAALLRKPVDIDELLGTLARVTAPAKAGAEG
ncbi:MAG TPA: PAS domain S-box protein [Azospirillum sp.]|nr:PAS domain S-box protein [Azospirillum sp.]